VEPSDVVGLFLFPFQIFIATTNIDVELVFAPASLSLLLAESEDRQSDPLDIVDVISATSISSFELLLDELLFDELYRFLALQSLREIVSSCVVQSELLTFSKASNILSSHLCFFSVGRFLIGRWLSEEVLLVQQEDDREVVFAHVDIALELARQGGRGPTAGRHRRVSGRSSSPCLISLQATVRISPPHLLLEQLGTRRFNLFDVDESCSETPLDRNRALGRRMWVSYC